MSEQISSAIRDYSTMDFAKIDQVLDEWETITTMFETSTTDPLMTNIYKELIDAQLDNKFAENFDNNIEKLVTSLRHLKDTLKAEESNMEFIDNTIKDKLPPPPPPPGDISSEEQTATDGFGVPTDTQLVDNSLEQLNNYKNMSMSDLSAIANELNKIATREGKVLDDILNNDEYSEQVKNLLLLSPNVSENLKQLITEASPKVSMTLLRNIFIGNESDVVGINETTKKTLKSYLSTVADVNNLSVQDLVNNEENSTLLKDAMSNFNTVTDTLKGLKDSSLNNKVLSIFDGDGIDKMNSATVMIIREHADTIANNQNSDIETILNSTIGTKEFEQLGKFSVFAGTLNNYDHTSMSSIINSLIS